jgi:type III pantothenate kinase
MLLAIDVGNTNTVFGLFRGEELAATWRMETDHGRMADEWAAALITLSAHEGYKPADIDAAICSSVVPPVTTAMREVCERYLRTKLMVVEPGLKMGVKISVDNPREVGTDRIVNAVAAHARYGGPAIVIDLGSATTFDVISPDGEYLGGAICPGMGITLDALFRNTAQLRRVELVAPRSSIGKNTVHAMQSGVVWGYVGLVEGLVARMKRDMGLADDRPVKVIGTGGLARLLAQYTGCMDVVDVNLTLDGLRMIWEMNRDA